MKKVLAILVVLIMMFSLCACGSGAIAGIKYEPDVIVPLDFGELKILSAGFAKEVGSIVQLVGGGNLHYGYWSAQDGFAMFGIKGILKNTSSSPIGFEKLNAEASCGKNGSFVMGVYPMKEISSAEAKQLAPGAECEITLTNQIPNAMYYGDDDVVVSFAGATVTFIRENLRSYNKIGFQPEDGRLIDDVTALSGNPSSGQNSVSANDTERMDELMVEDAYIERSTKPNEYILFIKARNHYNDLGDREYPNSMAVIYYLLDENKDVLPYAIQGEHLWYKDLEAGQAGWSPCTIDANWIKKATYIKVGSYVMSFNPHTTVWRYEGKYSAPAVFKISDIMR